MHSRQPALPNPVEFVKLSPPGRVAAAEARRHAALCAGVVAAPLCRVFDKASTAAELIARACFSVRRGAETVLFFL